MNRFRRSQDSRITAGRREAGSLADGFAASVGRFGPPPIIDISENFLRGRPARGNASAIGDRLQTMDVSELPPAGQSQPVCRRGT